MTRSWLAYDTCMTKVYILPLHNSNSLYTALLHLLNAQTLMNLYSGSNQSLYGSPLPTAMLAKPCQARQTLHSQNWYSCWGRRLYFKVAAESFPSWDTIRNRISFAYFPYFLLEQEVYHLLNKKPPLLLSTVMEFTFQVKSKLLTFSLRKLSTSSFVLNFLECLSSESTPNKCYTLKTGMLIENGDSILKLLPRVSRSEIKGDVHILKYPL